MRTIEEIKAEDGRNHDEYVKSGQTERGWEKFAEQHEGLRLESYDVITDGIPLDRLSALCAAEREGRCVVLPHVIRFAADLYDARMAFRTRTNEDGTASLLIEERETGGMTVGELYSTDCFSPVVELVFTHKESVECLIKSAVKVLARTFNDPEITVAEINIMLSHAEAEAQGVRT